MGSGADRARGEQGRAAELLIVSAFALVVGIAFLWALVLHQKPPRNNKSDSAATVVASTVTTSAVPVTLPPPRSYAVVAGGVNLRQGPATNTNPLGKLSGGTKVQVQCRTTGEEVTSGSGTSDQWLRVTTVGTAGYISALYADVGDDLTNPRRIGVCPR